MLAGYCGNTNTVHATTKKLDTANLKLVVFNNLKFKFF